MLHNYWKTLKRLFFSETTAQRLLKLQKQHFVFDLLNGNAYDGNTIKHFDPASYVEAPKVVKSLNSALYTTVYHFPDGSSIKERKLTDADGMQIDLVLQ